jgi:glyoxylase-like metal-dependent hydrolase (beta-lactamase superfamily II)
LLDAVKKVTTKPVVRIINTHTHGDHTGNNNKFGDKVEFVAHENTKANMMKMDPFKGDGAKFLPGKTYKDKMTLGSGKDRIDLMYFGPGHTSGDTWVWFRGLNVLATGDMFAWKDGPRIDPPNGGSGIHYAETLSGALKGVNNIETVIPGHSPIMKIKDLADYQKFVSDLIASTKASQKAGKSVDDAFAAFDVSKYPGYKNERVKASMQVIYDELKK